MTSKRRQRRRAWMNAEVAKRRELEARLRQEQAEAVKFARKDERDRLTIMLPPEDDGDVIYPQGRPEHTTVCVLARPDLAGRRIFNRQDLRYYPIPREFRLVARQKALILPDGTKVVWFGWQLQ